LRNNVHIFLHEPSRNDFPSTGEETAGAATVAGTGDTTAEAGVV